ncbi:MAG: site-2 protease family protein [Thermoguttaceae bacterium]
MDLCLTAVVWYLSPTFWIALLEVAAGLGFVIFVHELGHFAVAKACGVKVEKFYLGFDIAGLKLAKFRRGETEYGIGILPLGGYVKMLGQEDNPSRLREEIERAKQAAAEPAAAERSGTEPAASEPALSPAELEAARLALFDPRSYLAKSVPKRMAIISAGVIMNMIFALVMAVIAFGFGVREQAAGVGRVLPGAGAWQVGLKPGDKILKVGDQEVHIYRDVLEAITLGDVTKGIPLLIQRPGIKEPISLTVKTHDIGGRPGIGITNPLSNSLVYVPSEPEVMPALPGSPASECDPPLQQGDTILAVDGHAVENYAQLAPRLAASTGQPINLTVQRRAAAGKAGAGTGESRKVQIQLAANPMRWLGLVMEIGPITAIQDDSPAAAADIRPGDLLRTIDLYPVGDPMSLPDRLSRRAGQKVVLGIERGSAKGPIEVSLTLRPATQWDLPLNKGNALAVPGLGIAYRVGSRVQRVAEGTPAAAQGLRPGDSIVKAVILPPDKEWLEQLRTKYHQPELQASKEVDITFDEEHLNWPFFAYLIQETLPGSRVELHWTRDGNDKEQSAKLDLVAASDWFNPDRGFLLQPETLVQIARSPSQALRWGAKDTLNATSVVYRSLHAVGSGQVSVRNFGGPISIFRVAMGEAEEGAGNLLLFLTLLSANLAVINFLPIPVLDGGHMVLLVWEGVRGKPADERVQTVLAYAGLLFILALMVLVFGLDLGWIARPGR